MNNPDTDREPQLTTTRDAYQWWYDHGFADYPSLAGAGVPPHPRPIR